MKTNEREKNSRVDGTPWNDGKNGGVVLDICFRFVLEKNNFTFPSLTALTKFSNIVAIFHSLNIPVAIVVYLWPSSPTSPSPASSSSASKASKGSKAPKAWQRKPDSHCHIHIILHHCMSLHIFFFFNIFTLLEDFILIQSCLLFYVFLHFHKYSFIYI